MTTELLYLKDSYLREFEAVVVEVADNYVVLDRTAFHPTSGGVDKDLGSLVRGDSVYEVVDVVIESGDVVKHVVRSTSGLFPGAVVRGVIDWGRRYRLMRLHTASHILSAVMYRDFSALITGGHVYPEYARDDFDFEKFDREVFEEAFRKVNEVVGWGLEVKIYWLPRDEALKIPGITKLAQRSLPQVPYLRIVEIPGVDVQADGGPHVRSTSEIGFVKLLKVENRGKKRKRVYYTVEP
ncbi:MAG: alanyl-tRNA editing protein AlaXM [Sulfolobales archaeon]|nr:alanyl-tRNA editing protein AlaXM [Sulfolobales archaeon]MCX8208244.1 alanyl-tRNA editing protein AlaXM [Sulfolobales archaeon]MDW8010263.1 alanyl-tRNA editing protein AlaXM [Sulfolobales archaeon]